MSKVSTLSQAAGILTVIDEQGLDLDQVQTIRPYLTALAKSMKKGGKNNGLPDIETFRAITEGRAKVEVLKYLVDFDKLSLVPDGWEILPDDEQLPKRIKGVMEFDAKKVAFHFDEGQKDGNVIGGEELRRRLAGVVVYGAQLLDFYLANPHLIPAEWKGKAVFFWGTIYRRSGGVPCVRCLYWDGGRWGWDCRWLGLVWYGFDPALVPASQK